MGEIKAVFFDVDGTLYNTRIQVEAARRNAVKAMIEAGLRADEDTAYSELKRIVKEYGPNFDRHYDKLLEKFNQKTTPRIIAAGLVAYHNTKIAYLVPYSDTIPTLLQLREKGYKLGIITNGLAVKQWEKLIRLGLQHFFHTVVISSEAGAEKPDGKIYKTALANIKLKPSQALMVGDKIETDVVGAGRAGLRTALFVTGDHVSKTPACGEEEPDYIITTLGDLIPLLGKLK